VAYGSNEKARIAMFTFLRALDLLPMEWPCMHKLTGMSGASNSQVVEAGIKVAQCYVVLLTPDDVVASSRASDATGAGGAMRTQARPNVLAELGMTWTKDPSRTLIVTLGDARPPSNFDGIQRVDMDNSAQQRKRLVTGLKIAGCHPNEDGTDWLSAEAGGDFEHALSDSPRLQSKRQTPSQQETERRRNEIAAKAMDRFLAWRRAKNCEGETADGDLLRRWIKSGVTTESPEFDHGILVELVTMLRDKWHEQATCPTQKEYDDALKQYRASQRGQQGMV